MKPETLRRFLAGTKETRLYVTTHEFALAWQASRPRDEEGLLALDVVPCVVYWFAAGKLETSPSPRALRITADVLITRRIQTHLRHLAGSVPDEYLRRASGM